MNRDELVKEFIEATVGATKDLFIGMHGDGFAPMVHILCQKENEAPEFKIYQLPGELLQSAGTKDLLAESLIPAIVRQSEGVVCVCFVADAWAAAPTINDYNKLSRRDRGDVNRIAAATKAEKKECLMFNFSTYYKNHPIYVFYERQGGDIHFTQTKTGGEMDSHRSRFADLLKPDPLNN